MATANTKAVFREAVGKKIVGVYWETPGEYGQAVVLVLDDGTGLAFNSNGSYWTVSVDEVRRCVRQRRQELERLERELRDVLATEAVMELAVLPGD